MFFQNYSFAATCSSATPSEEVEIPNPVSIEVQEIGKGTAKKDTAEKEGTVDKAAEVPNDRNGTVEQTGNTTQNSVSPQTDLIDQLRNKVTNGKSVTSVQSRSEDVPPVENSNFKINSDDIVTNVRAANNNDIVSGNMDS